MADASGNRTATVDGGERDGPFLAPTGGRPRSRGLRPVSAVREAEVLARLTDRERDVVALTAQGVRSAEIGGALDIPPEAVDACRSRIMNNLQITHRSQLVRFARRAGLRRATDA